MWIYPCSGSVQPVFGRTALFAQQTSGPVYGNTAAQSAGGGASIGSLSGPGSISALLPSSNGSSSSSNSSAGSPFHQLPPSPFSSSPGAPSGLRSPVSPVGSMSNGSNGSNLLDYFPSCGNDGLQLNWAHAVNSRAHLNQVISGDEMMIEADVTLAESSRYPIPIMAHPPLNMSDLTLEDFLIQVVQSDRGKGVKLDFKSTRVVEPAFRVLARHAEQLRAPLILNADILPGEHPSNAQPVDAWTFLMLCRTRFPKSIISIGWCADVSASCSGPMGSRGYTRQMVDQMLAIVKEYSLMQPVTFPVNAALAKYSISELQRLLFQLPNSTLTLWAHEGDPVTIEDLLVFRKAFAHNQLFYDLPEDFLHVLRLQAYKR